MNLKQIVILLFTLFIFSGCQSQKTTKMNNSTVKELNLQRYLGTWYEIARFDHSFERNLVGVTASYSIRDDGKIRVINQGYKNTLDGELSVAEGKAKLTGEPGKLKVSFFWIFYGDYFVLELDKDYQWVLIGSSSDKYLWILSRKSKLEPNIKEHLLEKARQRGYDISKLIWVEQKTE
jgi:apolipoprotein D and lipocalin family protein